ncbi:MAG: hypothetical protein A7315_00400 [Candidatus Altiarchaeales archaeon WOR_SM1_79]|nr:MAG: hypothetical protein A7315_00400 [Candidatus Altiarchaeales archaeon WOR_SM1_79]
MFEKEKIIAVEGKDDKWFFERLLEKLGISDIQVWDIGSKGEFKNKFPDIRLFSGFNNVRRVAAILDADNSYRNSKESIEHTINRALKASSNPKEFSSSNPAVAYFIMPNNKDKGMMETLCVLSQKNNPAMKQVDKFIEAVNSDTAIKEKPKNEDKAKAQAYLAIMPEIAYGMAYGIVKNYWDLSHTDFKELINFLKSI